MLLVRSPVISLSASQKTTLGNGVAAQWPGIAIGDVMRFIADKDRGGGQTIDPGVPACRLERTETLDAATLFGLLVAGATISPGILSTDRSKGIGPDICVSAMTTAVVSVAGGIVPGVTSSRLREFDCKKVGASGVSCSVAWAKSHTAAQAYSLLQAGETLVPLGVE